MCEPLRYFASMLFVVSAMVMAGCKHSATSDNVNTDIHVNTYTRHSQEDPSISSLNDGGFVITWESAYGFDDSKNGIFAQRFDVYGDQVGVEFRVNTYIEGWGWGRNPSATALSDGGFVIAWQSKRQGDSGSDIYAQRFNIEGGKVGGEFQVNTNTYDDQENPSVISLNDGGFVVAWESSEEDGNSNSWWSLWSIYAQRFNIYGDQVGTEFQINTIMNNAQGIPSITALNDGGFVVTWESWREGGPDIYSQRFSAYSEQIGVEYRVNTYTGGDQKSQSLTALNDGGFVITWMSWGQDGEYYGIYAQRFNVYGEQLGEEFRVNTYTSNNQVDPSVTLLNDGGFVITWVSSGQDGEHHGIFAQRFSEDGEQSSGEMQVSTSASQGPPSITSLIDGGFVISWQGSGQSDDDSSGIYARLFNASVN